MRHQDLTINHRLESFVYANAAARTAAGGFVAGDVGRVAFQTDTNEYWRLKTASPAAWTLIAPAPAPPAAPVYAKLQTGQLNSSVSPTVTQVSPGVMLGFGIGHTLTPTATGKILVTIDGTIVNTIANEIPACQMRYGTGTPPAFGAIGTTGTQVGGWAALTGNTPSNGSPFSVTGLIPAAALGTALWFDLQMWNESAGGQAWVTGVAITAVELP